MKELSNKLNNLCGVTKVLGKNKFKANSMNVSDLNMDNIAKAENLGMSEIISISSKELNLIDELGKTDDYNYLIDCINENVNRFLNAFEAENYDLAYDINFSLVKLNNRIENLLQSCWIN